MLSYSPQELGAMCHNCPLAKDGFPHKPTPPEYNPAAKAVMVCESPGAQERWDSRPLVGPTGERVVSELERRGYKRQHFHIVNRIACFPPVRSKTQAKMRLAAACCLPRFQAEYTQGLPTIWMGKWAPVGTLSMKEIKRARSVVQNGHIVVDHPTYAFFRSAPNQVPWLAALDRFLRHLQGQDAQGLPTPHIWPDGDETLRLLNSLGKRIAWDVEVKRAPHKRDQKIDPLDCIVTCVGLSDGKITLSMPWDEYSAPSCGHVRALTDYPKGPEIKAKILELLTDPNRIQTTQNGMFDVLTLHGGRGIPVRNVVDTLHKHAIIWPEIRHNLEDQGIQLVNALDKRWKTIFRGKDDDSKDGDAYEDSPEEDLRTYNGDDCSVTILSDQAMDKYLQDPRIRTLYDNAMRNADIAYTSYVRGWTMDKAGCTTAITTLEKDIVESKRACQQILHELHCDDFNLNSNAQLIKLFYEVLNEPVLHVTAQGTASTNKAALAHIASHGSTPTSQLMANALLTYRANVKLQTAFVANLGQHDVVHPWAHVTATLTGRWSYRDPALQTIPRDSKKIKVMFGCRPGTALVGADYKRLELHLAAHQAGDIKIIEAANRDDDIHTLNAADLYGIPESIAKQPKFRDTAKVFAYRLMYSVDDEEVAAAGLHATLVVSFPDLSYRQVLGCVRRWWKAHPALLEDKRRLYKHAQEYDWVGEPFSGRRRYFWLRPEEQKAYNFPKQAGGSSLADAAVQAISEKLDPEIEWLILQKHDELIFETTRPLYVAKLLEEHMRQTRIVDGKSLTYDIDLVAGTNWGELKHFKTSEEVGAWWKSTSG